MATCPRCYEYLDDGHVCRGRFRRGVKTAFRGFVTLAIGALVGGYALGTLGQMTGFTQLGIFGAVAGLVAAFVIYRSLHRRVA